MECREKAAKIFPKRVKRMPKATFLRSLSSRRNSLLMTAFPSNYIEFEANKVSIPMDVGPKCG